MHNLTDGFIKFYRRNWGFAGDKGTWASYNEASRTLTVNRAAKGIISSAYMEEMKAFCVEYGINFDTLRSGERISTTIS